MRNHSKRSLRAEALERRDLLAASIGPAVLTTSTDGIWALTEEIQTVRQADSSASSDPITSAPADHYKLSILDAESLAEILNGARDQEQQIALPAPDGTFAWFNIVASRDSRDSFSGVGVDDSTAELRLRLSADGLHARVGSAAGAYQVNPFYFSDDRLYVSYRASQADHPSLESGFGPSDDRESAASDEDHQHEYPEGIFAESFGFGPQESGVLDSETDGSQENGINLHLTSAHLRNGNGDAITSPYIGEKVAVQVNFTTSNLPANAFYEIHFSVDGVVLSTGVISTGAGFGSGTWFYWWSGWFASPGTHNVQVTLDALGTVAESNESDNTASFTFSPTTPSLPQKLIWPIEGTPYLETAVSNYVDVDPLSGIEDFAGGSVSYNGHNAWDIGPADFTFAEQDAGMELYAAADGTVTDVHDGEFDRNTVWQGQPANFVIIDHGGGWRTIYWHFRRDSITVDVGDTVQAGDFIGYMGSSGNSSGTHVHFILQHYGFTVEMMYDIGTYMVDPLTYVFDSPRLLETGITNYTPNDHRQEQFSEVETYTQQSGQRVYSIGMYAGLTVGDSIGQVWRQPDGTVWSSPGSTMTSSYSWSWWYWWRTLPSSPQLGTWTIEFMVNGVKQGEDTFEVTVPGAAEIRVELPDNSIVLDGRHTPIDFGSTIQAGSNRSQSFTLVNHGYDTLTLGPIDVPTGYLVTEGLPSSLAAGASDSFTVELDATFEGYYAGRIRIPNNDADENDYDFSVEGIVESTVGDVPIVLGISERKLAEGGQTVANVRRSGSTASSLTVTLAAVTNADEVTVPASVTIPAGEERASFSISAVADNVFDADQVVELSAIAAGHPAGRNTLEVLNIDLDLPPTVETNPVINAGVNQRSIVSEIVIPFSTEVNAPASAFSIIQRGGGTPVGNLHVNSSTSAGKTTTTVTFGADPLVVERFGGTENSLVDGNYELRIDAAQITTVASGLQMAADYIFGAAEADKFFRFFGDQDGDRDVDTTDLPVFGQTFRKNLGDIDYNPLFDGLGDNDVDASDLVHFGTQFRNNLPFA